MATPMCPSSRAEVAQAGRGTSRAPVIEEKKLLVLVQAVIRHSSGCLTTKASALTHLDPERAAILARGRRVDVLDAADDTAPIRGSWSASRPMVSGAPISLIRPPANAGPPIIATDWVACSLALPSADLLGGPPGRAGSSGSPTSKNTVHTPTTVATTNISVPVRARRGPRRGGASRGPAPQDQVVGHQYPLLAPPVDPGARGQPDDQEGEELAGPQQAHLEGGRVEHADRQHRQRQCAQLGADLADRVAGEELTEVAVVQQSAEGALRGLRLGQRGGRPGGGRWFDGHATHPRH